MLISSSLTFGQVTFILRAAVQILGFGGIFLIGHILLASSPRTASLKTHDIINRAVSKSTFTKSSLIWVIATFRGKTGGPRTPPQLVVAISLLVLYGAFVSLSDVGFLGFHGCEVPGPSMFDRPNSVNNADQAYQMTMNATVAGNNLTSIKAYRCSSVTTTNFGGNVTEYVCDSWQNSTFANSSFFSVLNSTDSDILMPRQLTHEDQPRSAFIDLNTYYIGPGVSRIQQPTIQNGIAVFPHEQGFRSVFGVPNLSPQHSVSVDKAMALEVEMGCMALGIDSQHNLDAIGGGIDIFVTNGSWRAYFGPSYMEDILSKAADDIRAVYRPLFNESSLDSYGYLNGINSSSFTKSTIANILPIYLPFGISNSTDILNAIMGNCTSLLRSRLNLTDYYSDEAAQHCGMLGLGGTVNADDGNVVEGLARMVCATATQINMVSGKISTNPDESINLLDYTRIPADLNHLRASFYDIDETDWDGDGTLDTVFYNFDPYDRFTLSVNPHGSTSHYITQNRDFSDSRTTGTGSGGGAMTRVASFMASSSSLILGGFSLSTLNILNDGNNPITFNVSRVTKWGGELGASYVLNSLAYSGWVAASRSPMLVLSTGGYSATCYDLPFALGFLPLVLTSGFLIFWTVYLLFRSRPIMPKNLEYLYGGMTPLRSVVFDTHGKDVILRWENDPQPHLEVLSEGQPLLDADETAAGDSTRSGDSTPKIRIMELLLLRGKDDIDVTSRVSESESADHFLMWVSKKTHSRMIL
ncbi:hypothetical protein D9757_006272 [Collybiopsis confluens]|uniref:Uncharacterized protein n=1 Tax=Collybiopsis confluens TaxID=2823264 RepID=A0A8H5HJY2_9AGAR|nr:hypothetical protein D9757_006272 [Collybiopsis confluens]